MKILIISALHDPHALAVKWGLEQLGFEPVMWSWLEFPREDTCTYQIIDNKFAKINFKLQGLEHSAPFDVIWVRRKLWPMLMDNCHEDDKEFVKNGATTFLESILPLIGHERTQWINSQSADKSGSNKLNQLIHAIEVGFNVPDTLVGNSPQEVRTFFHANNERIINKPFHQEQWKNEDGSKTVARTALVSRQSILNDYAIRACPGIFQELIEKQYEIRVTVIGDKVIAAKLDSQKHGATIDWRFDTDHGRDTLSFIELPEEIQYKCLELVKRLNLKYAAIDLAFDINSKYIFFELNCAGQFLWVEAFDPSIKMLDTFCRYIANMDPEFNDKNHKTLHWAEFRATPSYVQLLENFEDINTLIMQSK